MLKIRCQQFLTKNCIKLRLINSENWIYVVNVHTSIQNSCFILLDKLIFWGSFGPTGLLLGPVHLHFLAVCQLFLLQPLGSGDTRSLLAGESQWEERHPVGQPVETVISPVWSPVGFPVPLDWTLLKVVHLVMKAFPLSATVKILLVSLQGFR